MQSAAFILPHSSLFRQTRVRAHIRLGFWAAQPPTRGSRCAANEPTLESASSSESDRCRRDGERITHDGLPLIVFAELSPRAALSRRGEVAADDSARLAITYRPYFAAASTKAKMRGLKAPGNYRRFVMIAPAYASVN